ncbi:YebB family permuted papain-like enzyme [Commensalibacter nepenthis]|uniref:YebB family permuted papain-like enzyme n=1 Tax=Commensalibacter nepenthis TaxID=3043872 RepID=A0ABT6Q8G8_9PROT|nr:YebB family permuted papain-like enzyme [Commensalibacter sp. TBRC 10068]MDI2112650.1 YebB family permuted papain-like enzyme [Commensalibacter sp. TBRC 10068]
MKNTQFSLQDLDPSILRVGDIVFIRIDNFIFNKVAKATLLWVNHVGIIVGFKNNEYWVAESTIPVSKITPLSKFIARSKDGSFAIARLKQPLTIAQQVKIVQASKKRMSILYDTGFNLRSSRQFCSRFVYEVMKEAIGIEVGQVESFQKLLHKNPDYGLKFWKIWFLGCIPWQRLTVTPASQYNSPEIEFIYEKPYQEII